MKKLIISIFLLCGLSGLFWFYFFNNNTTIVSPLGNNALRIIEKPLDKYSFTRLRQRKPKNGSITLGKELKDEETFASYVFYFTSDGKRVSGLLNMPKTNGVYPIVVMIRGYVDQKIYTIGEGTRHSGEVFAQNGFITFAPDFLGYGESDQPSVKPLEERFQTYTTVIDLISALKTVNQALRSKGISSNDKIFIWGHSNGGHIALSVLAATGKNYPSVLWNPVTKPFPYSILYFTDEFDDHGKALRRVLAEFEKDYDVENYSPSNFYIWIQGSIQLHQSGDDEAVPKRWSDQFAEQMKKLKKTVNYLIYPGDDHNFSRGSWPTVIQRSIDFYKSSL